MNIKCQVVGHNWVWSRNDEGTGKWQTCARCGKERVSYGGVGGLGVG